MPKEQKLSADDFKLVTPGDGDDETPSGQASGSSQADDDARLLAASDAERSEPADREEAKQEAPARSTPRTCASASTPSPSARRTSAAPTSPASSTSCSPSRFPGYESFKSYLGGVMQFDSRLDGAASRSARARRSSPAPSSAGSATTGELAPHLNFAIRPAGRGAPKIDPKPILDGWKLLEATAIYRAAGKNPFEGDRRERRPDPPDVEGAAGAPGARRPGVCRSTACGRDDIQDGQIDRAS